MIHKYSRKLLKIVGILIFIFLVYRTDSSLLLGTLQHANRTQLLTAIVCIGGVYITRAWRWHMLTQAMGLHTTFLKSWQLYCIGLFLGSITPGKMGEFSRAVYLQKRGLSLKKGILLGIIDRTADSVIIVLLGIISAYILNMQLSPYWLLGGFCIVLIISFAFRQKIHGITLIATKIQSQTPLLFPAIMLATVLGWLCYFSWAVLIAISIGIDLPLLTLVSIFTLTGFVSMLPIAPSGLGTRDATLIVLLAPYNVIAEQALALALLMFLSMITWNVTGAWYWFFHKKEYE